MQSIFPLLSWWLCDELSTHFYLSIALTLERQVLFARYPGLVPNVGKPSQLD